MADSVVHIGENSPEYVAYKLLHEIAGIEKKSFRHESASGWTIADRAWVLDTYRECLMATKGLRKAPGR